MKTILVPLDGSALAERALPFAATIAKKADWSILLLRAVNTMRAQTDVAARDLVREARAELDAVAARLASDGIQTSTRVVDKQPETAILDETADVDVVLVVMSTHGRGGLGRFIYGSVADTVLRHAPVGVLTVPPHGLDAWPTDQQIKIMVPLDGSELSRGALEPACELADMLGGSLLLASIVTFPSYSMYAEGYVFVEPDPNDNLLIQTRHYLEEIAAALRTDTRPVEVYAAYGSPYFGIMTTARDHGAGLIVMATHGRGGMTRALLGSVATVTVRQTDLPIMLVRPDEVEQVTEAPSAPPTTEEQSALVSEPTTTVPTVSLLLSADELETLTRIVAKQFFDEPVEPGRADPIRLLLEKLRTARAGASAAVPSTPPEPATSSRQPGLFTGVQIA
jgi:nucleotide-binding universal stress UspA family protein